MKPAILVILLSISVFASSSEMTLLKAIYTPVPDSDPEYAQGAIERNDLPHREIERFVWLIAVPSTTTAAEWQRRLNQSVDPTHGSFRVIEASAEERRKVESGEITLQR